MEDTISQAKAEFIRAKEQMTHALTTTPDDKLNWTPSATARTPIQQVAHVAMVVSSTQDLLSGKPFPYTNIAELDTAGRIAEKEFTTREQVVSLLEHNSAEYLAWLDTLTAEQLASTVPSIFGPIPMAVGINAPRNQISGHLAQMGYIQTIYGDHDWHMGG